MNEDREGQKSESADIDVISGILNAVDELGRISHGDILIFLNEDTFLHNAMGIILFYIFSYT